MIVMHLVCSIIGKINSNLMEIHKIHQISLLYIRIIILIIVMYFVYSIIAKIISNLIEDII